MQAKAILVALLLLVVAVAAQQQGQQIINTQKIQEYGQGTLANARVIAKALNYIAIAAMLGASVYVLFVRKRGFPELFGEWWFWVPIALNIVPVILYLLSDVTPIVQAVYNAIKGSQAGDCPFLYCP